MIDAADRARDLADRYWESILELEPMMGTEIGDERYDDRWMDPTETGRARSETVNRAALRELEGIDGEPLHPTLRGTLDILESVAKRSLAEIEQRLDFLSVANHFLGPGGVLASVASIQRTDTPERLDRYVARLRAFPTYLDAFAEIAREGIDAGVTTPRVVAERAVASVERLLALEPHNAPPMGALGDDATDDARDRIAGVVRDAVNPALERHLGVLREYLPHATETIALSALPGGAEMYATEVLAWTTLPLEPARVHELGRARFERIQQERREIAGQLGYANPADAVAARTASGNNTAGTREEMLALARSQVERSWDAASAFFGHLPSANCEVRPVEEFRETDMPMGFYNRPSEDGSRAGVYYINTSDLPERPLHHVASLTFHEANPGHHFQITIEQELPDRPPLRRFGGILAGSAFCEGWGLYSERLADEMGLYADEWERLGMLEAQALRAGRLITDTGIHALGWTRDRAIATLEEGGAPHLDAVVEIDRYIAMPGQALAYMIGMIEIEKARQAATDRDGASFSLMGFHDRVLALGQLPLSALPRELSS